jgi:alkylated DNA repair protein (DNA oxidative demethylase)
MHCNEILSCPGAFHYPGFLKPSAQREVSAHIIKIIQQAPLFVSYMPRTGVPMSVRMTNCGPLGWMSDKKEGYRYVSAHPETLLPWPAIPSPLLEIWNELTQYQKPPEACLVNVYNLDAKMALHQDRDEIDLAAPILSLSLGYDCRFRLSGQKRNDPSATFVLSSGDALVLKGSARQCFHGVDRILPTIGAELAPPLADFGVRLNLTLRRVT